MASIFQFIKDGAKEEVLKLIKENSKELLFLKDSYEQTPLHVACFVGQTELVSVFIKKGSKLDLKDKNGWTPLHCAASVGHLKACDYLIQKDPGLACLAANDGTTAFHYLVRYWDPMISPKMMNTIVKHDPTIINITAHNMETPLHNACLKNCEGAISYLLSHKADTNRKARNGETCLTFAIRAGYKNVVKLLLEHGINEYGTAYQIAAQQQMDDVKTMVEQCQQFLKIRTNNEKDYKKGYLHKFGGKMKGWKKTWTILDGIRLRFYQSEEDKEIQGEVLLKEIESIITEEQPGYHYCLTITLKDSQQKIMIAADDKISMAKWALAIDGLKFKFFDTCLNQFTKKLLMFYVYKENYKGGIIKSSFEEEWSYSSDGILQCTEAAWSSQGANSLTYLWDGQQLLPQNGSHSLGWGKWNGFLLEWYIGELGEKGEKQCEYYWEEIEREYLTESREGHNWKWTRHFLTLKTGSGEWILEGEVPEPVVFFLQLLRYSRLSNDVATVGN